MAEKKYYYEHDDIKCTEICPFLEGSIKIGSFTCRQCKSNIESSPYNIEEQWVICKEMKDSNIPSRNKTLAYLPLSYNKIQTYEFIQDTKILGIEKIDDVWVLILLQPVLFKKYVTRRIELYPLAQEIPEGLREYIGCMSKSSNSKFVFEKL